jgi:hypothetical protein
VPSAVIFARVPTIGRTVRLNELLLDYSDAAINSTNAVILGEAYFSGAEAPAFGFSSQVIHNLRTPSFSRTLRKGWETMEPNLKINAKSTG